MWEGVETQSKSKKTTNQRIKTNKKEHKILNIYAYLSIILMQQYSLFFLRDENLHSYCYLDCICFFEHQLNIPSIT